MTFIFVVVFFSSGCTKRKPADPPALSVAYPELLIVFPHAENVDFSINEWGEHLYYILKEEDFPATNVLTSVSQVLSQRGWSALKYDFLNPDIPSSHVGGWGKHIVTAHDRPKMEVHQWMGQWKRGGDVVWYNLRYRYPVGEEDFSTLYVSAHYTSAPIARRYLK